MTKKFFIQSYRDFILRYHRSIILIGVLLAIASFMVVRTIKIKSNLASLLPDSQPSVQNLNKILEKVGGYGEMITIIETKDFESAKRFAADLKGKLDRKDYIRYADYRIDFSLFDKNALLFLDKADLVTIRDRIKERIDYEKSIANPLYVSLDEEDPPSLDFSEIEQKYRKKKDKGQSSDGYRYYANDSKTILLLVSYPSGITSDIAFARKIYAELKAEIAALDPKSYADDMEINITGNFKNRIDEYTSIIHDITSSAIWSIGAIFLLITIFFRNLLAFFLILFPLTLAILITFAITKLTIGDLNLITAFLFLILFGLGIDFGIHTLSRYLEDRSRGVGTKQALTNVFRHTAKANFISALTTAVAFFLLMITDFKGFSQFGYISGLGVMLSFLSMISIFPALLVWCDRHNLLKIKSIDHIERKFKPRPFPYPKATLVFCIIGFVLGSFALSKIEFEYDFAKLRSNIPGSQENKNKVRTVFKNSRDPAIVYVEDESELDPLSAALDKKIAEDKETPTIEGYDSVLSVLPKQQGEKKKIINEIKVLVSDIDQNKLEPELRKKFVDFRASLEVQELAFEDLPEGIKRKYRGEKRIKGTMFFIYNAVQLNHGLKAIKYAEDISEIRTPAKVYHPSSEALIFADMVKILTHDSKIAIALALLGVFLCILFDLRSIERTLIVLSPLICGMAWIFAVMVMANLKLNLYNMVALPSIIGLGVDHGVHIFHRYLEERRGSLRYILRKTGSTIAICTLTTIFGFAGMISATHAGLQSLGILAIIGIGLVLISTLTILPAILQLLENTIFASSVSPTPVATEKVDQTIKPDSVK